jgi:cell division septum initiation protein DivIVA
METNETQLDYFLNVVLRNYCRTAEENDILYQEMDDLKTELSSLYQQNADLRFRLNEAGIFFEEVEGQTNA